MRASRFGCVTKTRKHSKKRFPRSKICESAAEKKRAAGETFTIVTRVLKVWHLSILHCCYHKKDQKICKTKKIEIIKSPGKIKFPKKKCGAPAGARK